jgi:transcriptional regulator with XRE-family HTH domain
VTAASPEANIAPSDELRARFGFNLGECRRRLGVSAGHSQEALSERAMVTPGRIGAIENGKAVGMLDTYVRLAGSLSITLDDLRVGVAWTPGVVELEFELEASVNS